MYSRWLKFHIHRRRADGAVFSRNAGTYLKDYMMTQDQILKILETIYEFSSDLM